MRLDSLTHLSNSAAVRVSGTDAPRLQRAGLAATRVDPPIMTTSQSDTDGNTDTAAMVSMSDFVTYDHSRFDPGLNKPTVATK